MNLVPHIVRSVAILAGVSAVALGGCGEDEGVPSDGVAKVGDRVVKKSEFEKWLKANPAQAASGSSAVPDPPDFTRCVAAKAEQPRPKGSAKPSEDQLKQLCKVEYDQRKRLVMEFLIEAEWVKAEAEAEGVKVSDTEVRRSLDAQREYAFDDGAEYKTFLRNSGLKEEELLYRMRVNALQQKINQKVRKEAKVKPPSDAEVRRYYKKNERRFTQPELRTLNVVVTENRGDAQRARTALQDGQSFKQVAERYSVDEGSKRQGGKMLVAEGQRSRAPEQVFDAPKGQLQGPVKAELGYYVYEVTKVTPATKPTYERAKLGARSQLVSQRQQKAVEAYEKRFQAKYRELTTCAEDFRVPQCKNGPKEEPGAAQAGGAPPAQSRQQEQQSRAPAPPSP